MPTPIRSGNEFLVNTITSGEQTIPVSTSLAGGGFAIAWIDKSADGGDIRVQIYSANGTRVGSEILVNTTTTNVQTQPAITYLSGGGFVVGWTDNSASPATVKAQIFTATGTRVGGELTLPDAADVDGGVKQQLNLLSAGTGFAAVWLVDDVTPPPLENIRTRFFNASGSPTSGELPVNQITTNLQSEPSATRLTNGNFVVVFRDNSQSLGDNSGDAIHGRIFNASGTAIVNEFLVNSTIANGQEGANVIGLAGGGFVVAWRDFSGASGDFLSDVRLRLFSANGTPVGNDFLAHLNIGGAQAFPAMAALPDGRFVVAWSEAGDVRAQVWTANGTRDGSEFVVHTATTGNQVFSGISVLNDGRFVISWLDQSGALGDPDGGIIAQIFDPRANTPVIVSNGGGAAASIAVAENSTAVTVVTAPDKDFGHSRTFSIIGGADAGLFQINAQSGALTFVSAPDYEAPNDTGADHVYSVTVRAAEGTLVDDQALTISVFDVTEPPTLFDDTSNYVSLADPGLAWLGLGGSDTVIGTAGTDVVDGGEGYDNLYGGAGNDTLSGGVLEDIVVGDAGDDVLYGGDGGDVLSELFDPVNSGDDTLDGGNGIDIMYAAAGNDTVYGGTDAANNYGNLGDGNDTYYGSSGTDVVEGGTGDDTINGFLGDDSLYGDAGNDTIYGGAGIDLLSGSAGNDTLDGGADNDLLVGDAGNDVLRGGDGIDVLYGFADDDILNGGAGLDGLFGGAGNDAFQVGGIGYGYDYVWDFQVNGVAGPSDTLVFQAGHFADAAAVRAASVFASGNTTITIPGNGGGFVVLVGVNIAAILDEDLVVSGAF